MKLAYLVNEYPRTSHTFIRREIRALEAEGHEVLRFSVRRVAKPNDADDQEEFERTRVLLAEGLPRLIAAGLLTALSRPLRLFRALWLTLRVGWRSYRGLPIHLAYLAEACLLLRWTRGVDWLHAHFGTNPATVAMLLRELGGPGFSFTVHGPEEFDKPEFLALPTKIRRASFTAAVSEFGRSQLLRWSDPQDWEKIHVVRCGVGSDFLGPVSPPPSERRLVCVARLTEQKGHLVLLEATARLARQCEPFHLTLVGDGPMRRDIEAFIRSGSLERYVHLAGWMGGKEVREEIARSRCLVLPSFAEGLPVVILEALALGRPVISTSIAGIPEVIQDGVTGWLVPAGSVELLAKSMAKVLAATPEELARMGNEGARYVAERHDSRVEGRKLAALFARYAFADRAAGATQAPAEGAAAVR